MSTAGATTKVCKVLRLFQQLIKPSNTASTWLEFENHIPHITKLVSSLQKEDVNFYPDTMSKSAPVTFINIFDDNNTVSASIFAIQEGCSLPMHDHPRMYGFIKCIYGALQVTSYSQVSHTTPEQSLGTKLLQISARREPDVQLSESNDDVAVLTPTKGNMHSITAVGGPGAFIDFLVPPYSEGDGDCHYFNVETNDNSTGGIFTLQEIKCPSWYWSASAPYCGPSFYN